MRSAQVYVRNQPLRAFVELTATQSVTGEVHDELFLSVDLNEDGKMDTISASYWMRWGLLGWDVKFAGLDKPALNGTGKRIGVLSSKTMGVHDLVNDLNQIYRWDGDHYVSEREEDQD